MNMYKKLLVFILYLLEYVPFIAFYFAFEELNYIYKNIGLFFIIYILIYPLILNIIYNLLVNLSYIKREEKVRFRIIQVILLILFICVGLVTKYVYRKDEFCHVIIFLHSYIFIYFTTFINFILVLCNTGSKEIYYIYENKNIKNEKIVIKD